MPKSGHAALAYGVVAQADKHEHNCTNANAQNCLINAVPRGKSTLNYLPGDWINV